MPIVVTALHLHPIKGLRGHAVTATNVERLGFAGDRRWMLVNEQGRFLSQRDYPAMARIAVTPQPVGLLLEAQGLAATTVSFPPADAEKLQVTVWRSTLLAAHAGATADSWFTRALGLPCRLVYLADPEARQIDTDYAQAGDRVSFADGFPVLLTAEASLEDLNRRLAQPAPMRRFRPNLVIAGAEAWAEDHWRRIKVGMVVFRLPKPCSRCVVTSVDQQTWERPDLREPLHTLATFRRTKTGSMFGQNMIPETLGRIAVGDPVTMLETGPSNVEPDSPRY